MSSLGILAFRIRGQEKSKDSAQHSMHVSMFNTLPVIADVLTHGGDSWTRSIAACVICAVQLIDCWLTPFPNYMSPTEFASNPIWSAFSAPGARYCIHTLGHKPFMLAVSIESFMKMLNKSSMCAGSTPRSMHAIKGL
ncbi:hypothetical protein B0H13DRAFT_2342285 [Mycena leptocephala]|nr:hypothetical protein B0H13DRAFT_2342285 [Mycena leptocephala]